MTNENELNNLPAEVWEPLQQQEKDAEKIERPSLTFFQDGWRRLKANKVAMVSMIAIVVITLGAIVIPWFWPYSYKQQDLNLANLPAVMKVYPVDEENSIYVTPQYMLMVVSPKGELKGLAEATRKDMAQKKNYFDINGKAVVVDYSFYSDALKEYKKLEKSAKKSGNNMVQVKKADYLKQYFEGTDTKEISLSEAQDILENKMARTQVTCDGEPLTHQVSVKNQTYLLGTDGLGRDLFIRIVYGARISLLVGFFAAFINFVVGVFYGAIAGYAGGQTDNIMMRIVDVLDSIPMTLYVILIMVVVGPGIVSIILALGLTFWVKMARIVRGQVLTLKQQEFALAAYVIGAGKLRILFKHLIINCMGPIIVSTTLMVPEAIFTESFLAFIGIGISLPQASWGTLASEARSVIQSYPLQIVWPVLAICLTVLSLNFIGDGVGEALDPKNR